MTFARQMAPYLCLIAVVVLVSHGASLFASLRPVADSEAALQTGGVCVYSGIACTVWCNGSCAGTDPMCVTTAGFRQSNAGIIPNDKVPVNGCAYIPCGATCCNCGAYCGYVFAPVPCGTK
jgi:hypothetical protein